MEDAERLRRMYLFAIAQTSEHLRDLNQVQRWSPLIPSCSALVARRRRRLALFESQAVILTQPLNQFTIHTRVCDSAILARLLGCCWSAGSSWRLFRLYRKTGSTRRFIRIDRGTAARWQVLFLRRPAFSLCRDLCQSSWSTLFITQINDDDVCQRFYTAHVMTSWQRY